MAQHLDILEALDRHGADLSAWPDPALAGEARRRALSDRGFRARLDEAAALEAGLAALRGELDAELSGSGVGARVEAAVLAALPRRRESGAGRRWALVAAAVLVAAALGALADVTLLAPIGSQSYEVVVLDPLFLDPAGTLSP